MKKITPEKIKEKLIKLKSQFDKDALIYLMLLTGIVFYGFSKFVTPGLSELGDNLKKYSKAKESIEIMQKKIAFKKMIEQKQNKKKPAKLPVRIYKTPYEGMELESASAGLVNKIISIIKDSANSKILSLEYKKKELKDKTGISSKKHSLLSLQIELETSYEAIQNILNELYLMNYLVKVNTVSLSSMKKYNYKRVQAFLVIDLFIDTSS